MDGGVERVAGLVWRQVERGADGVLVADAGGRVLWSNPAARALLGEDREALAAVLGVTPGGERQLWIAPGGRRRPVAVLRSEDVEGVALLRVRDRAEEAVSARLALLRERLAAVGRMTGSIAHDLSNSLVPIITLTELLRDTGADAETLEIYDAIVNAALEAKERVRGLLADNQVGPPTGPQAIDLADVIRAAVPFARGMVKRHVALVPVLPEMPVMLVADFMALRILLLELVGNAIEAIGPKQGMITLTLEVSGEEARLVIADDGPGMDRARLFEPFHTTKTDRADRGLGLAVCERIAAAHGGRLEAAAGMGSGVGVAVCLPLRPAGG